MSRPPLSKLGLAREPRYSSQRSIDCSSPRAPTRARKMPRCSPIVQRHDDGCSRYDPPVKRSLPQPTPSSEDRFLALYRPFTGPTLKGREGSRAGSRRANSDGLKGADLCRSRAMLEGRCPAQSHRPRSRSARNTRSCRDSLLIVWISSFTLSLLGPLRREASIDLQELMSVDCLPRSARVQSPRTEGGARAGEAVIHCAAAAVSAASIHAGRPAARAAALVLGTIWSAKSRTRPSASLGNTSTPR